MHWAGTVRHSVTRTQLEIDAWIAEAPERIPRTLTAPRSATHFWATRDQFLSAPIGAASRKALAAIEKSTMSRQGAPGFTIRRTAPRPGKSR
jgi:hypothetical protein